MRTLKTTTIVSAAFMSLLLSACGGGSSSPLDPPASSASSQSSAAQLSSGAASSIDTTSPADIGLGDGDTFISGKIGVSHTGEELAAGAKTTLSVNIVSSTNTLVTAPMEVTFNSRCVAAGEATLSVGETQTNKASTDLGQAIIVYTAKGCVGNDEVTATAVFDGVAKVARTTIVVAQDTVQSIRFVDALPNKIYLKDSGGPQTSTVRFLVLGNAGAPIKNIPLQFTLSTQVGGITLTQSSATTDNTGHASTVVQAGTVPTSVEVIATETGSGVSTRSNKLSIGTGMPDQNSMSISASRFNPPGWEYDGEDVDITIRLADMFNNPPPDGTSVQFVTEGGVIDPNCTTENGVCTVKWKSQAPRPTNGRVTILATTLGNESFKDVDGDGLYTKGVDIFNSYNDGGNCNPNVPRSTAESNNMVEDEPCDDLGEAYLDQNENGVRDNTEEYVDINTNKKYDTENGIYNGVLCAEEGADCTKQAVHIRQDIVLSMSSQQPLTQNGRLIGQPALVQLGAGESHTFTVDLADIHGNAMPIGTTVSLNTSSVKDATVNHSFTGAVGSTLSPTAFSVTISASETKAPSGPFSIVITSPKGTSYSFSTTVQPKPLENTTALYLGKGVGDNFLSGLIEVENNASVLPPGGKVRLTVNLVNGERNLTTGLASITFRSACYAANQATFTNSAGVVTNVVETYSGSASIFYTATGCNGSDEIIAEATLPSLVVKDATTTLNIFEATAQYIVFESAVPEFITLKGTGNDEVSQVTFKVLGSNNQPVSGSTVTLKLNDTPGGICLVDGSSCSKTITRTSNAEGLVTAFVQSGTIPASVRITATASSGSGDTEVSTQSSRLVVTTGIPDQDSISLAATEYSVLSVAQGYPVTLSVRLADAFNNPVPDNTAVNFVASHGAITGGCLTSDSACQVIWKNQGTRPVDGKLRILATTQGNESFIDVNGDGIYDAGDIFSAGIPDATACDTNVPLPSAARDATSCDDLGEAYLDANNNGIYDFIDGFFVDIFSANGSPVPDGIRTPGNGMYDGLLCPENSTICTRNTVTVREDLMLVVSDGIPATNTDGVLLGQPGSLPLGLSQSVTMVITLQDNNGNSLPSGTTVELNTDMLKNAEAFIIPEEVVVPNNRTGPTTFKVVVEGDPASLPGGSLYITVKTRDLPEHSLGPIVSTFPTKIN